MTMLIDVSTPAGVISLPSVTSLTTASFTPPLGSLLLVCVNTNWDNTVQTCAISTTGHTNSWMLQTGYFGPNSGITAMYTTTVTGATATTVTATFDAAYQSSLKVWVITGAHNNTVTSFGEGLTAYTPLTITYPAAAAGSVWFAAAQGDLPLAFTGSTTDASIVVTDSNYMLTCHQTTPATTASAPQTITLTNGGDGAGYAWIEVVPSTYTDAITTGRVVGMFYDSGTGLPLVGTITFTPTAPLFKVPTQTPHPITYLTEPVTVTLDVNGRVNGSAGQQLTATGQTSITPYVWSWVASFNLTTPYGGPTVISPVTFLVPANTIVDLTLIATP